jgi:hypothetical protein
MQLPSLPLKMKKSKNWNNVVMMHVLRGGLADEFELDGPEGNFAKASPVKGKKCATNDVRLFQFFSIHITFADHYDGNRILSEWIMLGNHVKERKLMEPEELKGIRMKTCQRVVQIRIVFANCSFLWYSGMWLTPQTHGISPMKTVKMPCTVSGMLCIVKQQLAT